MCSYLDTLVVFQVVEEHRASNVNVEEQQKHLPGVRHWEFPATVRDWSGQLFQVEPPATQGTRVPLVSM